MLPFNKSVAAQPRELTGRIVLTWLVGFFAVVFAVNGVMAVAAISTFSGLDSDSPYQAGLAFDAEIAAAPKRRCTGKFRPRWPGPRRARPGSRSPPTIPTACPCPASAPPRASFIRPIGGSIAIWR